LIEASVRFMNLGRTSPSWPAVSNSAASHKDRTVPTSCAKHSVHVRSVLAFPSASRQYFGDEDKDSSMYAYSGHPASGSNPPGITYSHDCLER